MTVFNLAKSNFKIGTVERHTQVLSQSELIQENASLEASLNSTASRWAWLSGTRALGVAVIFALAAAGWAWMLLGIATLRNTAGTLDLGPGMSLSGFDGTGELLAWCAQSLSLPSHGNHGTGMDAIGISFSMWAAMTFGMMLPTAAPMITTYTQIADTAARRGKTISSVFYLIAGYLVIWLGFAVSATGLQIFLFESGALSDALTPAVPWLGASTLILAGGYQFSTFKLACLAKCRMPFSFFFANWREHKSGVFGLGIQQGLVCLGCCWALMLVMFAVGLMNLVWMALLGILMLLEKIISRPDPLRWATGAGLLIWGNTQALLAAL